MIKKTLTKRLLSVSALGFLALTLLLSTLLLVKHTDRLRDDTAQNIVNDCEDNILWRSCYVDSFIQLTRKTDLQYSLSILDKIQKLDARTSDCHLIAHNIASIAVSKNPTHWLDISTNTGDDFCGGGFIHGALEAKKLSDINFKLDANTIVQICDQIKKKSRGVRPDEFCSHIMGHLLLVDTEGKIEEAVEICSQLSGDIKFQCLSGVFMESYTRENLSAHQVLDKVSWDSELIASQEKLCNEFINTEAEACWFEMAHLYDFLGNSDPNIIYNLCNRAPNQHLKQSCTDHASELLILSAEMKDDNLKYICSPYAQAKDAFEACIDRIISAGNAVSGQYKQTLNLFCNSLSKDFADICLRKLHNS